MKVFVIDDQPVDLKLVVQVLTAAGHVVDRAIAAETALPTIRESRPDVILVDLFLPGMGGLELVRMLKLDPATSEIPVVAVTSFPEEFSAAEAMAAGCNLYLTKPLSTRTLPELLAGIATRPGSPNE